MNSDPLRGCGRENLPAPQAGGGRFESCRACVGANPRELRQFIVVEVRLRPISAKNEVVVDLAEA